MSSESIVTVDNIAKCYRLYQRPQDRLWQFFIGRYRKLFHEFWALSPVSFELQRGECLGLIGKNGSGKSTLLQLLAGTLAPTSGSCTINGKLSALLELGAGFNPEFTGRENAILNGTILGFTPAEMRKLLPSIEQFADIGRFFDNPVKTYSSGMYVRLAFSVAIHVEPDVLIVDEALSVGDTAFQYKCLRKIEEMKQKGMCLILVSHDVSAIRRFCNRAAWLDLGRLVAFGEVDEVTNAYEDFLREEISSMGYKQEEIIAHQASEESPGPVEENLGPVGLDVPAAHVESVRVLDVKGKTVTVATLGSQLTVEVSYKVTRPASDGIVLGVALFRNDDEYICALNTYIDKLILSGDVGTHTIQLHYQSMSVLPGSYYFKVGLFDSSATVRWDFLHRAAELRIVGPYAGEGYVILDHRWETVRSQKQTQAG
jgi:teichoic acid transport system ATP-binding protein